MVPASCRTSLGRIDAGDYTLFELDVLMRALDEQTRVAYSTKR